MYYRRVRIKRPGFGDIRTQLNRGVGTRSILRQFRHVHQFAQSLKFLLCLTLSRMNNLSFTEIIE